jgi:zinc protease
LWAFAVTPAPRRIAEASEAAVGLLLELARVPPGAEELARARAALEADLARGGDGPLARAHRLGFERAIARDDHDRETYLQAIRTLGPAELRDAATRLGLPSGLALAVAVPAGAPAGREEAPAVLKPRLEVMLKAAPDRVAPRGAPAVAAGDAIRFVTPGGVRVVALRDKTAPLVSVEAAWVDRTEGPVAADEVASLIAGLLDRGTRTRSAADVAAEVHALGGSLKGFAAPGALGLRADFLPRHLERGLALVADTLAYPAFPEEAAESEGRAIAFRRRAEAKTSAGAQAALGLFQETLWPAARRAGGEPLSSLTKLGLLDRYRRRYPLSRLVVAVVGDVDPAQVVAAVARSFPSEPARARITPAPPPAASPPPAAPTTVFRAGTMAESTAIVGYPTFPANDSTLPDRLAVEVLADVLGGPGDAARLASALRDDRTAGCLAGARAPAPGAPGYLAVSLTCAPARLDAAVAAVRAELARLAAQGLTPDEVTRSTRRLSGARAASLRTGMAIADALVNDEAQGLPMFAYRRDAAALAAVTAADVARVARVVLDAQREVVAVVHPPAAAPALARTAGAER